MPHFYKQVRKVRIGEGGKNLDSKFSRPRKVSTQKQRGAFKAKFKQRKIPKALKKVAGRYP
jgi:hypothetical protein